MSLFAREDDTIVLGLEPLHRVSVGEFVLEANLGDASSALGDGVSWALHDNVEVHTIDTLRKIKSRRRSMTPLYLTCTQTMWQKMTNRQEGR